MKALITISLTLSILLAVVEFFILSALINAWVLTYLWAWFIVPLFVLPKLGIAQAYGLVLIVTFFKIVPESQKSKTTQERVETITAHLASPFAILGLGYLVKCLFL